MRMSVWQAYQIGLKRNARMRRKKHTRITQLFRRAVALLNCKTVSISGYYSLQNSTISSLPCCLSIHSFCYPSDAFAFWQQPKRMQKQQNPQSVSWIRMSLFCICIQFQQHMLDMLDGWIVRRSENDETRRKKAWMPRMWKCLGKFFVFFFSNRFWIVCVRRVNRRSIRTLWWHTRNLCEFLIFNPIWTSTNHSKDGGYNK